MSSPFVSVDMGVKAILVLYIVMVASLDVESIAFLNTPTARLFLSGVVVGTFFYDMAMFLLASAALIITLVRLGCANLLANGANVVLKGGERYEDIPEGYEYIEAEAFEAEGDQPEGGEPEGAEQGDQPEGDQPEGDQPEDAEQEGGQPESAEQPQTGEPEGAENPPAGEPENAEQPQAGEPENAPQQLVATPLKEDPKKNLDMATETQYQTPVPSATPQLVTPSLLVSKKKTTEDNACLLPNARAALDKYMIEDSLEKAAADGILKDNYNKYLYPFATQYNIQGVTESIVGYNY